MYPWCLYPLCMYPWCRYPWYMYPGCFYPCVYDACMYDANIFDPWSWYMCVWCMTYLWCMYLWASILDPESSIHDAYTYIFDPDACVYDAGMYDAYRDLRHFCKTCQHLLTFICICICRIVVNFRVLSRIFFAFSDNPSAENSKLSVNSGNHGILLLECMYGFHYWHAKCIWSTFHKRALSSLCPLKSSLIPFLKSSSYSYDPHMILVASLCVPVLNTLYNVHVYSMYNLHCIFFVTIDTYWINGKQGLS